MKLLNKIKNKEPNIFDNFILLIIIISSILIGIETNHTFFMAHHHTLVLIDLIILSIFIFEIFVKVISEGRKPLNYFKDPWNVFDFFIVLVSLLPLILTHGQDDTHALAVLRILRILRITRTLRAFRVLRLVTKLKPLQLIIETLIKSIPSMAYVMVLLGIIFYLYAVIGCFVFGVYDPQHFGNLGSSYLTLFESVLGNWSEVMSSLMQSTHTIVINGQTHIVPFDYPFLVPIYFISFYFVGGLIILNLFIGVIVTELSDSKNRHDIIELREQFRDDLTEEQFSLMKNLEEQLELSNQTLKKLKISLDKNCKQNK